ncbi:DNA (cytosine-5-)-methyltransferase [Musa troglodytarum]|uniref:DNA (cytosine-5-)-methyltransferase n=1 Tax=Musa troglodytarum TaxID=320322 RepID=A0A9E7EMI3_9LILI|nr:DNA (cytosine-5-)-methyltransferase [Musa troglodytarum]
MDAVIYLQGSSRNDGNQNRTYIHHSRNGNIRYVESSGACDRSKATRVPVYKRCNAPQSSPSSRAGFNASLRARSPSLKRCCLLVIVPRIPIADFIEMGFSEDSVMKAVEENGGSDRDAILETLLASAAIEESPARLHHPAGDGSSSGHDLSDEVDFSDEDSMEDDSEDKLITLVEMGFPSNEASAAIHRCGPNASIWELADSIHAAEVAKTFERDPGESSRVNEEPESHQRSRSRGKKRKHAETRSKRRRSLTGNQSPTISSSRQMVGFGLPDEPTTATCRRLLPEAAAGPPYFYYENDALAPKEVWATISHLLYDVEPEFVDSKHFCAASRKRAYAHNLPIQNRFPVMPVAPKTIQEALPETTKWWPAWDTRTQLNCLLASTASARLTDKIRKELQKFGDPPPSRTQRYVVDECRRWNLIWVGRHKVAPLEPGEIETVLGFPKDHTRGGGITRTERYRCLGSSFQVDTVGYHLSVLRDMFPNGMTVLSLFSGIGGAEVALHRLGIHLRAVVSVENSEQSRSILRSWWAETNQTGTLIEHSDVRQLDRERLEQLIARLGGFDLVIGGSPWNDDLAGSSRRQRDGLQGDHSSSLFYEYFRILELVRGIMGKKV